MKIAPRGKTRADLKRGGPRPDSGKQRAASDSSRRQAAAGQQGQKPSGRQPSGQQASGQQASGQQASGQKSGEPDSQRYQVQDLKQQLKDKLRREARGETVEPAQPKAGPKPDDTPPVAKPTGLRGMLVTPNYAVGIGLAIVGTLPLAMSLLVGGGSPLSAPELTIRVGEGIWTVLAYAIVAALLIRDSCKQDRGLVWFNVLLLAAVWLFASHLGAHPPGSEIRVADAAGLRALYALLHATAVLWVIIGAALAARLAQYPLGGALVGVMLGLQGLELVAVSQGQATFYDIGIALFSGALLLPLVILESMGRAPKAFGEARGPGMLSRLIAGVPSLGEELTEQGKPKGRPLPGMSASAASEQSAA